jgi:hypothetical protein
LPELGHRTILGNAMGEVEAFSVSLLIESLHTSPHAIVDNKVAPTNNQFGTGRLSDRNGS